MTQAGTTQRVRPCACSGAATSAGCSAPGCWPSSATASSRRRSPARCCSTRSGRPIRSPSPPGSPSCCCPTPSSAPSPASGWTGGAAARCCCVANVVRAGLVAVVAALVLGGVQGTAFYAAGLAVFSVNRFVLAALSAGLPHTTDERLARARPTRCRRRPGRSPPSWAAGRRIGAAAAHRLGRRAATRRWRWRRRCPTSPPRRWSSGFGRAAPRARPPRPASARLIGAATSARGMVAGARHVWARPPAAAALLAISLHRLWLRRPDADDAAALPEHVRGRRRPVPRRAGRAGRGRRRRRRRHAAGRRRHAGRRPADRQAAVDHRCCWSAPGSPRSGWGCRSCRRRSCWPACVLGFVAQGVKICVDTTLQETVEDDFRGRVFSVYDTLFNVTFVVALLVGAFLLPPSGISYAAAGRGRRRLPGHRRRLRADHPPALSRRVRPLRARGRTSRSPRLHSPVRSPAAKSRDSARASGSTSCRSSSTWPRPSEVPQLVQHDRATAPLRPGGSRSSGSRPASSETVPVR